MSGTAVGALCFLAFVGGITIAIAAMNDVERNDACLQKFGLATRDYAMCNYELRYERKP